MQILISNNAENLTNALNAFSCHAVVEAEFGSVEVMGSSNLLTLNHHVRPGRPCPCLYDNAGTYAGRIEAVGISHFDLDTLGGVLALQGRKPKDVAFWRLAAWVDTHGPHRVKECPTYTEHDHIRLAAFWSWSQKNRLFAPRDGSCEEVSSFVDGAHAEIVAILNGQRDEIGQDFLASEAELMDISFVAERGPVVLRTGDTFTNHLYYGVDGQPVSYVVALNTKFKSITISKADASLPISCKDFVQELWGALAGGHDGIAGSPRGQEMTLEDAQKAFDALVAKVG